MATITRRTVPDAPARPTLDSYITPTSPAAGTPTNTTVADYIIEQIKAGVHPITAAGAAGVSPPEYQAWIREGQYAISRLHAGQDWLKDFTPEQQDLALFSQRAIRAHSEQVARLTVLSEQVARGGLTRTSKRTKTVNAGNGAQVVEEVTSTETTLPDGDMLKWRLEHIEPAIYGKRATLAVTVTDLTDTDSVRDLLAERIEAIIERFTPKAIETTATEVEP